MSNRGNNKFLILILLHNYVNIIKKKKIKTVFLKFRMLEQHRKVKDGYIYQSFFP